MTAVADARTALIDALKTVEDLRVYSLPSATVDPPAAVVSLPDLTWETPCSDPTTATFEIALIVPLDDRAIDNLQDLVLQAQAAIDENVESAAVLRARTGSWGDTLPAYLIETEVQL